MNVPRQGGSALMLGASVGRIAPADRNLLSGQPRGGSPPCRSIDLAILLVPGDEAGNPLFNRCLRRKPQISAGGPNIGKAFQHVTGLDRQHLLPGGAASRLFNDRDELQQVFRLVIAEVVKPVRWLIPGPARVGGAIMRSDRASNDVVYIGEITRQLPLVEDLNRPALKNCLGEQPSRHVRTPPRAVGREITQPGCWQSV